ncbi:RidA family protein [Amycolatopsis methanolica]|uniref:Endoribonuclease L-PSP family protein n=1 Tax=Amycolatopsis methanolica 239 TaxID=1068978 RepID=A0A076N4E1_AMYME|nr:RidA family protein [Amycolatopsis methanolica]AIJ26131.1 endoribonuclease L-PSP family protein [Amycolatopsis methanolica 239]
MTTEAHSPVDRAHPYSPARLVGDTAYVSGALAVDRAGEPVTGASEALDAALDRLEERLGTVGLCLADLVKLTYFVTDISLREAANDQLIARFEAPRPARSFLAVSALPYGATVEIEAVARRQADDGTAR